MAVLDIRQRSGYLFLAVLLGHVILISAQVQSKGGAHSVLEGVTFGVFAEMQRTVSATVEMIRHGWGGYVGLRSVRAENDVLKRQLDEAQISLQQQRALADRTRALEQLLDLRARVDVRTTAAEVIAASVTPDFRTVTIAKGSSDGIKADMAVIAPAGVVGRVVVPSARASKVQLLIDNNAAAAALIERSRAQGIVVGAGTEQLRAGRERLRLEYVSEVADVRVGDIVVTSGIDGIFPKGFVIGRVESVEKNGLSYKQITVQPAVDFSSLEEVLVVTSPLPAADSAQDGSP